MWLETLWVVVWSFAYFAGVYLLCCGAFYGYFWVWKKEARAHKRVEPNPRQAANPVREIKLSVLNSAVFALVIGGIYILTEAGWTRIYYDVAEHSIGYFILTVVVIIIAHDVWHYVLHRALHGRWLMRHIHYIHHEFTNPTPFASYALHPVETLAELAVIGALLLIIPIHPAALAVYIAFLSYLNAISHLGYEFYRPGVSKWFITSTHHFLHHDRFNGNFILYFPVLDRWLGGHIPDTDEIFDRLARAHPPAEAGYADASR
jgi:sterol desaturase/sphingolipid hydroxylase (fatty acid hydroxylase superfamily)